MEKLQDIFESGEEGILANFKAKFARSEIEKYKIPIALTLVGVVLVIGGLIINPKQTQFPKESLVTTNQALLKIDIAGAVHDPGVYELAEGSRIQDIIIAAGGVTVAADKVYLEKSLNMAQKISDGIKIYIPYKNETGLNTSNSINSVLGLETQNQINLNNATAAQLESLTGVGPATSAKIISNRPYQKVEELLSKKVVGKATFEKIKGSITVY